MTPLLGCRISITARLFSQPACILWAGAPSLQSYRWPIPDSLSPFPSHPGEGGSFASPKGCPGFKAGCGELDAPGP